MTHTSNYNFNLPAGVDDAAVTPLNQNFTMIDTYLKSNLNQMAEDYDSTKTYNTDDIVAHDNAIYKCLDDGVTGDWDSTKWDATTLGEEVGQGGGGSSVVVNPSGTQDEVLDGLEVDGTNYGLDVISEVSGLPAEIATFNDGADAPLYKCVVNVEAVQDLHGYDNPWSAGGGKNMLPITQSDVYPRIDNGITLDKLVDDAGNWIGFKLNGTATANTDFWFAGLNLSAGINRYITIGLTSQYNGLQMVIAPSYIGVQTNIVTSNAIDGVYLGIASGTVFNDLVIQPMICLDSESDKSYAPYSNICPISGHSEANLWIQSSVDPTASPTATADFNQTIYGGSANLLTGEGVITHSNIASYNGETLTGEWISSMDVYSAGGTPTTGAQVVYELAAPTTFTFDAIPTTNTFEGQNNIYCDTGNINELGYFKNGKLTRSVVAIVEAMTGNINTILADAIGEE